MSINCQHAEKLVGLLDAFQRWRGVDCPYCEIALAGFTFKPGWGTGKVWMHNLSGEGVEVSEAELRDVLSKFFDERF